MRNVVIIHVGNMNNKGTQALLKSDVSLLRETAKDEVVFAVSTTDIDGVKKLLNLAAVLPPMVDIPYERADSFAKRIGLSRGSWKYKAFAFESLVLMFLQMALSAFSAALVKIGLRPIYRGSLLERLKNCDVVISYSDENFKEGASQLPPNIYWIVTWWTMLISRTWDVLTAKFLKRPVIMFPNSVGPFCTWIGRALARLALNRCDCVLIREPKSYRTVSSLGIKASKILTADTTLLLKALNKTLPNDIERPVIGVSVGVYSNSLSEKEFYNFVESSSKALDTVIEQHGFKVMFIPHYVSGFRDDDYEFSELILERMRHKDMARIVSTVSVEEFKSFLSEMDMVISSKMHPAVLAISTCVPAVCIAYDDKQVGFFEQLGMVDCVLPVHNITGEALSSKINYVWSIRNKVKDKLKRQVPILQTNIRNAAKKALAPYLKK